MINPEHHNPQTNLSKIDLARAFTLLGIGDITMIALQAIEDEDLVQYLEQHQPNNPNTDTDPQF